MEGVNNNGGLNFNEQLALQDNDRKLFEDQKRQDEASFARSMALMALQRQQQEQMQFLNTMSAMQKNDHDGKMAIIHNLKTG